MYVLIVPKACYQLLSYVTPYVGCNQPQNPANHIEFINLRLAILKFILGSLDGFTTFSAQGSNFANVVNKQQNKIRSDELINKPFVNCG